MTWLVVTRIPALRENSRDPEALAPAGLGQFLQLWFGCAQGRDGMGNAGHLPPADGSARSRLQGEELRVVPCVTRRIFHPHLPHRSHPRV